MVFEHIENLKNAYTDKNVIVAADRPELGRFQGLTGTVKTVNMSGRALVEFDGHKNIGWFDIDVDFLKLVDKAAPVETPIASPAAKKPAAKKPTAAQPDATPTDPANMNVADMLAAARGESAAPAAAEAPAVEAEKPAAATVDPASMSVEDMLAAARAESAAPPAAEEEVAEEEVAEEGK